MIRAEPSYLLDTSAILAYLLGEAEARRVASLIEQSAIPFIAVSELYAALWLRFGQAKADEAVAAIRQWAVPILWPTPESVLLAGKWRARYRLGLGDSYIAALAFLNRAVLITKDSDFLVLAAEMPLLHLSRANR